MLDETPFRMFSPQSILGNNIQNVQPLNATSVQIFSPKKKHQSKYLLLIQDIKISNFRPNMRHQSKYLALSRQLKCSTSMRGTSPNVQPVNEAPVQIFTLIQGTDSKNSAPKLVTSPNFHTYTSQVFKSLNQAPVQTPAYIRVTSPDLHTYTRHKSSVLAPKLGSSPNTSLYTSHQYESRLYKALAKWFSPKIRLQSNCSAIIEGTTPND